MGKYLTDWSGPEGELKKVTIKLGATVFPGDTLTAGGKVARKYEEGNQHLVDVEYHFSVAMGPHAWGSATMALPVKGERSKVKVKGHKVKTGSFSFAFSLYPHRR